jgi:hypothetical protein
MFPGTCEQLNKNQHDYIADFLLLQVVMLACVQSCWRNIHVDGVYIDCFTIDPLTYDLPHRGVLCFDYFSYDVPALPDFDVFARTQTLRSELFRIKRPPLWIMCDGTPPVLPPEVIAPPSSTSKGACACARSICCVLAQLIHDCMHACVARKLGTLHPALLHVVIVCTLRGLGTYREHLLFTMPCHAMSCYVISCQHLAACCCTRPADEPCEKLLVK